MTTMTPTEIEAAKGLFNKLFYRDAPRVSLPQNTIGFHGPSPEEDEEPVKTTKMLLEELRRDERAWFEKYLQSSGDSRKIAHQQYEKYRNIIARITNSLCK